MFFLLLLCNSFVRNKVTAYLLFCSHINALLLQTCVILPKTVSSILGNKVIYRFNGSALEPKNLFSFNGHELSFHVL